jgi:choline dehydrogenase-like flavoprotein
MCNWLGGASHRIEGNFVNIIDGPEANYDIVLVGSGFAASFFLHKYLARNNLSKRILVVERGSFLDHERQVFNRAWVGSPFSKFYQQTGDEPHSWEFSVGFGGSSNCWVGNTPRLSPSDFRLNTLYGVGRDWPISYEELEPYVAEVESIMQISGPVDTYWPQAQPYPLPAHRISQADQMLKEAEPAYHFEAPTARASRDTETRPSCCANGVCSTCPIDAKFTILNGMKGVYEDPQVSLLFEAEVTSLDMAGGRVRGVNIRRRGQEISVRADLVVLAANALFNPFILLRSGFNDGALGRFLHCNLSFSSEIFLDGIDHFDGGSFLSCHNFRHYDGDFRRHRGSMLIETMNVPTGVGWPLRTDFGRWRQVIPLIVKIEDMPQEANRVVISSDDSNMPATVFNGFSAYANATYSRAHELLAEAFAALPVERIEVHQRSIHTGHIHGTTVMGTNPETSVVDRDLIHHKVRNLILLGSGAFPSGSQVNPTLCLSALSLRCAERLTA